MAVTSAPAEIFLSRQEEVSPRILLSALVNNRDAGSIDSGGNVTFNIGGALTTTADASFITSNRNDGNGGGTIGSNVAVTLECRERFHRRIFHH